MSPAPPHTPQTGEIALPATKAAAGIEVPGTRPRRIAKAVAQRGRGRR